MANGERQSEGSHGSGYGLGLEVVHTTSIPVYLQGRLGNAVSCVPRKRSLLSVNSLCPIGLCPAQMLQAERAKLSSVPLNPGLSDALALLPSLRLLPIPCPVALPGSFHFKALLTLATPV